MALFGFRLVPVGSFSQAPTGTPDRTSNVLNVHGATGCPQVIHNLWARRRSLPAGWSADFPEPVLARENRLTVPND